jgi:Fe-S cluster assembly protein SufD
MSVVHAETAPYLEAFRARRGEDPAPLALKRERALARFGELGFPTRRTEAWRFTDLRRLQRAPYPPADAAGEADAALVELYSLGVPSHRIVLANGRFVPALSRIGGLPAGSWFGPTASALAERPQFFDALDQGEARGDQPFVALNTAFFRDGFVLILEDGATLDRPVEILHLGRAEAPLSVHLRSAILAGAGSRATVIETFAGTGEYFANVATSVRVGQGAVLRHVKLQDEAASAIHIAATKVVLADAARYDGFALTLGGGLSRNDTFAAVEGQKAYCGISGAYLLRGRQDATNATFVDHAAPCSETREVFKGVVEDRAHGVFQGKILVRPEAQKTDANQTNRNLLLSERAAVDTKPELEIFADDVKCSHGATVGDLDETAMFYLRARAIPEAEARRMLIEAFAVEAIELVEEEAARAHLRRHLDRWLAAAHPKALNTKAPNPKD